MAMAATEVGATLGFLGVQQRQMGVVSEAENRRFFIFLALSVKVMGKMPSTLMKSDEFTASAEPFDYFFEMNV